MPNPYMSGSWRLAKPASNCRSCRWVLTFFQIRMLKSLIALTLYLLSVAALAGEPTLESIDALLMLTRAEAQAQQEQREFAGSVREMVYGELHSYRINQTQKEIAENLIRSLDAQIELEFSWMTVRSVLLRAYQESLSQSDVDELIAIYRSLDLSRALPRMERANLRARELFREQLAPAKAQMIQEIRNATHRIRAAQ